MVDRTHLHLLVSLKMHLEINFCPLYCFCRPSPSFQHFYKFTIFVLVNRFLIFYFKLQHPYVNTYILKSKAKYAFPCLPHENDKIAFKWKVNMTRRKRKLIIFFMNLMFLQKGCPVVAIPEKRKHIAPFPNCRNKQYDSIFIYFLAFHNRKYPGKSQHNTNKYAL